MQIKKLPFQKLVLICQACASRNLKESGAVDGALAAQNPGEDLKVFLKSELKAKNLWGSCRVVSTSCLSLCPQGATALCVVEPNGQREIYSVDPEKDRQEILELLSQ